MREAIDWSGFPEEAREKLVPLVKMVDADDVIVTPRLRAEARSALAEVRAIAAGDPAIVKALRCVRDAALVLAGVSSIGADSELARRNCIEALQILTEAFRVASTRGAIDVPE